MHRNALVEFENIKQLKMRNSPNAKKGIYLRVILARVDDEYFDALSLECLYNLK